jgi:hypothetical protein
VALLLCELRRALTVGQQSKQEKIRLLAAQMKAVSVAVEPLRDLDNPLALALVHELQRIERAAFDFVTELQGNGNTRSL